MATVHLQSEKQTQASAAALAHALREPCLLTLRGELGAGKTTWVRALLAALGHDGVVPSPTYMLLEPYELPDRTVVHMDLYRMQDDVEMEELGIRELLDGNTSVVVEWPERSAGLESHADLQLELRTPDIQATTRELHITAVTPRAEEMMARVDFGTLVVE